MAKLEFTEAFRVVEEQRSAAKKSVEDLEARYESMYPTAVAAVVELILTESKYPDGVTRDFSTGYKPETRILILEDTLSRAVQQPCTSGRRCRVSVATVGEIPSARANSGFRRGKIAEPLAGNPTARRLPCVRSISFLPCSVKSPTRARGIRTPTSRGWT
ncbi:MAG TPA: hypothetical protein VND19_02050 [Acetobacteraceae bacterium]|nr:hypothetical protein [Acetobacteraceae bacterium]